MLSREAEALYWIGRYLERAEATARRFDVQYHSRLESDSAHTATLPYRERYPERAAELQPGGATDPELGGTILMFLILDPDNPNSIRACVTAARENARGCREQISSEMWEHLNRFHLELGEQTLETLLRRTPHELLHWVKCSCWLFDGIAERTMIRGEGWQFLQAGKFLERADATARLLDGKSYAMVDGDALTAGAVDLHQWIALLKSAGAYEAFRKTAGVITPAAIIGYVLLDARFPGAIRYSIERVEVALRAISRRDRAEDGSEAERQAGRLLAELVHARAPEVLADDLHGYLTRLMDECAALHEAIVQTFFSHLAWRPWDLAETVRRRDEEAGRAREIRGPDARPLSPPPCLPVPSLDAPGEWPAVVSNQ